MSSRLLVASVVLAACSTTPHPPPERAFSPAPWLEDLTQLEDQLGLHYANLEWIQRHRGVDLAALDRAAREALSQAASEREAVEAMVRFIAAFRDPHLAWTAPAPPIRYDLWLTSDGASVRIRRAGPGACGARPGDIVETIQGRPALEQLQARLPLSRFPNLLLQREDALGTFTSHLFAPPDALRIGLRREGSTRECVLAPRAPGLASGATTAAPLTAETPGVKACQAMGISTPAPPASPLLFPPDRHPAFSAAPLPGAGTVRLASGETLGWLRLPLFSVEAYPTACAEAWEAFRARLTAPCDDQCQEGFRERALVRRLVEAIAEQLKIFRAARVSGVVVDITDNGGGNDWAVDVAQLLSPGALSCPAGAEVREPAAAKRYAQRLQELEACPAGSAMAAEVEWAKAVLADVTQPCDWRSAFRPGAPAPSCSMLARSRRSMCRPSLAPGGPCASPDGERGGRGLVDAPVYVLVNRRTASAAEFFAAVLRDNGAATLVGERTLGAGCGYVDGGNEARLSHSGLVVRMPNCARYRADGSNEVEGIPPDVELPWTGEDLLRFDSYAEKALAHADALFARPGRQQAR